MVSAMFLGVWNHAIESYGIHVLFAVPCDTKLEYPADPLRSRVGDGQKPPRSIPQLRRRYILAPQTGRYLEEKAWNSKGLVLYRAPDQKLDQHLRFEPSKRGNIGNHSCSSTGMKTGIREIDRKP